VFFQTYATCLYFLI